MEADELFAKACARPDINDLVGSYCFDDLEAPRRLLVETHLLECDRCWAEVQRLEQTVRLLRSDRMLAEPFLRRDVPEVLGISAKGRSFLGGHARHVVLASGLYALWYPLALLSELAYEFDRFKALAILAAPSLLAWIAVTTILALALDWRNTWRRGGGFSLPALVLFLAAVAPVVLLWRWLPGDGIVYLRFQAYTAQAGYLKTSALYGLPLAVLFLLAPYHCVLALQRAARGGRRPMVLALLTGNSAAVAPRGVHFLAPRTLWLALAGAVLAGTVMTAHLIDNLQPRPGMGLFMLIVEIRTVVWVSTAVLGILWYQRCLNELKRECLAVLAVEGTEGPQTH